MEQKSNKMKILEAKIRKMVKEEMLREDTNINYPSFFKKLGISIDSLPEGNELQPLKK